MSLKEKENMDRLCQNYQEQSAKNPLIFHKCVT